MHPNNYDDWKTGVHLDDDSQAPMHSGDALSSSVMHGSACRRRNPMRPNERLGGCLCGGCLSCLRAQGHPMVECPDCEDGWHHDPEERRNSVKCGRCLGTGEIPDGEPDDA